MNILYIHTHDTGRYIQPYGYGIPTPALQGLAEEGVLFRNAFCCGPTCSPSRAALLTGMNPHASGMLGLAHRGFELSDYSKHLARFLGRHGFETALCGMHHEAPHAKRDQLGYEKHLGSLDLDSGMDRGAAMMARDRTNCEEAVRFLQARHDRPFFLSFGMFSTHRPFPPQTTEGDSRFVRPPEKIADHSETRKDMAGFIQMARTADDCVKAILQAVRESGLENETCVFFTTDHGAAFPYSKCTCYDTGIGVSLIFRFPGRRYAGCASDALVSHLDIFPTLCELAGLDAPAWLEGRSILPLLEGKTKSIRDEVFSEVTYHAAYEPIRAVRTGRYKLIRRFDDFKGPVLPNIDNGPTKALLLDRGLRTQASAPIELYDLLLDPQEKQNLAGTPGVRELQASLTARLDVWMRKTGDPLLAGRVPRPKDAVVNVKTGLHAEDKDFETD